MRSLSGLCCAVALAAFLAPGLRADEYNRQTFLTFSGPVQLPRVTLPAGTYMLKLADPDGQRNAIQIWDKDQRKLYTTLLTVRNQRMEPPDDPVVMFSERPAGEAQAIKAWFYPGTRIGQEFIYPKDQAVKIAKASHTQVLAISDESKSSDIASMKSAKVGRVDENGNVVEENEAKSTTTAAAATTTANAPRPSANRAEPQAPAAVAQSDNTARSAAERSNVNRPASNNTAPRATGTAGTLPRTASGLELMELLSGLSLAGALAARQLRKRFARA